MNNIPFPIKIFSGNSNKEITDRICDYLRLEEGKSFVGKFSDGEIRVEIKENVRGCDAFIVQSICPPDINTNFMELCLIVDALKRASAKRITAVVPYYGYARQDRKVIPRVPISAKLIADTLSIAGINRLLTVDLHAGQIQGFFNCPVDNLYASKVLLNKVPEVANCHDIVIVSPDAGGIERANKYSKTINCNLAMVYKHRDEPNKIAEMKLIGDVKDKYCILIDDMVDTAGTICSAAKLLYESGSKDIYAYITHPVLSGNALERIENSRFTKFYVTDSIPLSENAKHSAKIEVVSIAPLIADAIDNIHNEMSVSKLFI